MTVETNDAGLVVVTPVGAEPIPPHVGGAIDVAGATLVVDTRSGRGPGAAATAGNVPPTATIFDPYWALTWVAGVYGDAVVDQVKAEVRGPAGSPVAVDASFGYLSDVMVRLGIATWLHRHWPSGNRDLNVTFSPELLELEVGGLRWIAEAAFIEKAPIERVLRPHASLLHSIYDWNLEKAPAGRRQDLVEDVLVTALRAVVDTLPESSDGYEECLGLLTAIDAGLFLTHEDWIKFAELLRANAEAGVLVRGKGGTSGGASPDQNWTTTRDRAVTYDLRDVPPRTLADTDGNVTWLLQASGRQRRLIVDAVAAPTMLLAPPGAPLMARAFLDGRPVLFDLAWTLRDGIPVFSGSALVPPDLAAGSIEVGVFHPAWAGEARLEGTALEQATSERREINEILVDRHERLGDRLARAFTRSDPSERPTAAEVVAQRRG